MTHSPAREASVQPSVSRISGWLRKPPDCRYFIAPGRRRNRERMERERAPHRRGHRARGQRRAREVRHREPGL